MPRGWRPCPKPGCPVPTPPSQRYCDEHVAEYEAKRGTASERGYDQGHQKLRARWKRRIEFGLVQCSRCELVIQPGDDWHLDHDDEDRRRYRGPSHAACNMSAGGRKAHAIL